jgi:fluoride ion exporter CrcB/FEX
MTYFLIASFIALVSAGAILRWYATKYFGLVGTLLINLLGAFALGLLTNTGATAAVVLGTGALGSLTTISGLALHFDQLLRNDKKLAIGYLVLSLSGGIAAALLGIKLVT